MTLLRVPEMSICVGADMHTYACAHTNAHTRAQVHAHTAWCKGHSSEQNGHRPTALTVPTFRELAFWNIGSSLNNSSYN